MPASPVGEKSPPRETSARSGFCWLLGAKALFLAGAYAVLLGLPRIFASPVEFGRYATSQGLFTVINGTLHTAVTQSFGRLLNRHEVSHTLLARLRLLQGQLGGALAVITLAASSWIAHEFLLDLSLRPLVRIGALAVFAYAIYSASVGALNGTRRFVAQAKLDAIFTAVRTTTILTAAAFSRSALGAWTGWGVSVAAIAVVGWYGTRTLGDGLGSAHPPEHDHGPSSWNMLRWVIFLIPLVLYQGAMQGMLQGDLLMLKRTVAESARVHGVDVGAAAEVAAVQVAVYRAAQTFAGLPYQLSAALAFVIFPALARLSTAEGRKRRPAVVRQSLRACMVFLTVVAVPIAAAARGLIALAYPAQYAAAASVVPMLTLATAGTSLFATSCAVLNALGKPWWTASAAGTVALGSIIGLRWLVMSSAPGLPQLEAAAAAVGCGALVASALGLTMVSRYVPQALPWPSILRCGFAGLVVLATARQIPEQLWWQGLVLAASPVAIVLLLVVTGELSRQDFDHLVKQHPEVGRARLHHRSGR